MTGEVECASLYPLRVDMLKAKMSQTSMTFHETASRSMTDVSISNNSILRSAKQHLRHAYLPLACPKAYHSDVDGGAVNDSCPSGRPLKYGGRYAPKLNTDRGSSRTHVGKRHLPEDGKQRAEHSVR